MENLITMKKTASLKIHVFCSNEDHDVDEKEPPKMVAWAENAAGFGILGLLPGLPNDFAFG
jgi:hypothetical protein